MRLYDQLLAVDPSPVVALHRAVAVAETDGPAVALALVDRLDLDAYYLLHAVRAELLDRLADAARPPRPTRRPSSGPATSPNVTT